MIPLLLVFAHASDPPLPEVHPPGRALRVAGRAVTASGAAVAGVGAVWAAVDLARPPCRASACPTVEPPPPRGLYTLAAAAPLLAVGVPMWVVGDRRGKAPPRVLPTAAGAPGVTVSGRFR